MAKPLSEQRKAELRAYNKIYYREHKEERHQYFIDRNNGKKNISKDEVILQRRRWSKQYSIDVKNRFLDMYGRICSCCGESNSKFLTIEHINGQHTKKRQISRAAYLSALKEYRPDLYEVLCYNCNCAKGIYGICPHKEI